MEHSLKIQKQLLMGVSNTNNNNNTFTNQVDSSFANEGLDYHHLDRLLINKKSESTKGIFYDHLD